MVMVERPPVVRACEVGRKVDSIYVEVIISSGCVARMVRGDHFLVAPNIDSD